jgi:hypothetical protein
MTYKINVSLKGWKTGGQKTNNFSVVITHII